MPILNLQVGAELDDAYDALDGSNFNNNASIVSVYNHPDEEFTRSAGLRFAGVTIPHGATIESAVLTLETVLDGDDMRCNIHAHDVDNADDFDTTPVVSDRILTSANVLWISANMDVGPQESPDISAVIQEVINRAGWSSGNAIVLICLAGTSFDNASFHSYDGNPTLAAKLDITWTYALETVSIRAVAQNVREPISTATFVATAFKFEDRPETATAEISVQEVVQTPPKLETAAFKAAAQQLDSRIYPLHAAGISRDLTKVQVDISVAAAPSLVFVESLGHSVAAGILSEVVSLPFATAAGLLPTWPEPLEKSTAAGILFAFGERERLTVAVACGISDDLPSLSFATAAGICSPLKESLAKCVAAGIGYSQVQPIETLEPMLAAGVAYDLVNAIEPVTAITAAGINHSLIQPIESLCVSVAAGIGFDVVQPIEPTVKAVAGGINYSIVESIEQVSTLTACGLGFDLVQPIEPITKATSAGVAFRFFLESAVAAGIGYDLVQLADQPIDKSVAAGVLGVLVETVETVRPLVACGRSIDLVQPIEPVESVTACGVSQGLVQAIEPVESLVACGLASIKQVIVPTEKLTAAGLLSGVI